MREKPGMFRTVGELGFFVLRVVVVLALIGGLAYVVVLLVTGSNGTANGDGIDITDGDGSDIGETETTYFTDGDLTGSLGSTAPGITKLHIDGEVKIFRCGIPAELAYDCGLVEDVVDPLREGCHLAAPGDELFWICL